MSSGGRRITGSLRPTPLCTLVMLLMLSCRSSSVVEPDTPRPGPDPKPDPSIVLSEAFIEDFSFTTPEHMTCNVRTTRDDFRYFPAFPSISERNGTVLLLRIDPSDAAGIKRGPSVYANNKCYYGTYSSRLRVPKTTDAQNNVGLCCSLALTSETLTVALELRPSDPSAVYVVYQDSEDVIYPVGLSAESKFYIYGIDWNAGHIIWWMQTSENAEKIVLKDLENDFFKLPAQFSLNYYHSKLKPVKDRPSAIQAPLYAYELEVDWLKYLPLENE